MLQQATADDFAILIDIWERSVRATHDFLPENEINRLRPLILNQYFPQVLLYKYMQCGQIAGFLGSSVDHIEMLFIDPIYRGQGIGKTLVNFAVEELKITQVDVNEQNDQALGFYLNLGFEQVGRSELDGQGKPYPLLHLNKV